MKAANQVNNGSFSPIAITCFGKGRMRIGSEVGVVFIPCCFVSNRDLLGKEIGFLVTLP